MSTTGDVLGERYHSAATDGIQMDAETTQDSLNRWKSIANAWIDFLANMGSGNPIVFKCGNSEISITASSVIITHGEAQITVNGSGIDAKVGGSRITIDSAGINMS